MTSSCNLCSTYSFRSIPFTPRVSTPLWVNTSLQPQIAKWMSPYPFGVSHNLRDERALNELTTYLRSHSPVSFMLREYWRSCSRLSGPQAFVCLYSLLPEMPFPPSLDSCKPPYKLFSLKEGLQARNHIFLFSISSTKPKGFSVNVHWMNVSFKIGEQCLAMYSLHDFISMCTSRFILYCC